MPYVVCEFKNGKPKAVSGEFSSPKFGADYIALASKNGGGKGLRVMVKVGRKIISMQEARQVNTGLF
ncbi:hypothetical protein DKL61_09235 [Gammaproteobacteria bacterium ESL0073]|nr:hypothetical protein DKL61_09235 [Gammaproteobacteria bacterium ESL0073]